MAEKKSTYKFFRLYNFPIDAGIFPPRELLDISL